jgi:surface protein
MSNPELNPFVEANACSTCPSNQFATTTSDNDDLSCCATVAGGTCTACTSAVASGCTAVSCNTDKVNIDYDATNGCEVSCAAVTVTNGTCTACTSAVASGCTAVSCNTGKANIDNDATNGCEIDSVPNGDGSSLSTGNPGTLRRVVSDWIAGGALKDTVVAKYGEIENWGTSEVTDLGFVFYWKSSFNADISKWDVSRVTNLWGSTSFLANS